MNKMRQNIMETIREFEEKTELIGSYKCLLGFDAFVDEIADAVDERKDCNDYSKINTIHDFGNRIVNSAGMSRSLEIEVLEKRPGGSSINMGLALLGLGTDVTYMGVIGYPEINAVFSDFANRVSKFYNIGNPGHTTALEFSDGKIKISNSQGLRGLNWKKILKMVDMQDFKQCICQSKLIAFNNWASISCMDDINLNLQKEILSKVKFSLEKRYLFLDLNDISKRNAHDIISCLQILKEFSPYYKVVLSINKKEALELMRAFDLNMKQKTAETIIKLLYKCLDIYCLVIHLVESSAAIVDQKYYEAIGPYTNMPKILTGGGDNFNAGFITGLMLNMNPRLALILGMGASGFYVRNAKNSSRGELVNFLNDWSDNLSQDSKRIDFKR
jgi:hypothetical protein